MAPSGNQSTSTTGGRIPLRERFKAWWEGHELPPVLEERVPPPGAAPSHGDQMRYEAECPYWQTARLRLVQEVFGEGFSSPGGPEHVFDLVKSFALDPKMSVLDIGAGLGGATRVMCDKFGVWVTGLEPDSQLAEAGMALSTKAGLGERAPVIVFDPGRFEQKPKSIDCIFSKEFLYTVEDKAAFLRTVASILKGRGQLIFTDYVLPEPNLSSPALDKWMACEPKTPHPWALDLYQSALSGLGLEVRVAEDVTGAHHRLVTRGWADYILQAQTKGVRDGLTGALVDEVELWTRRMQAIDSGDLKVCRVHALKKDIGKLLSSW